MSEKEKKEQNYVAKLLVNKEFKSQHKKSKSSEKKFKGKPDMRNNKSKGTNGMRNNMPLTKEHQMMLGEGEVKPSPNNPRGFSKKQLAVLNFFRDRESKNRFGPNNNDGHFSSWGGETNSFRNKVNTITRTVLHSTCSSHRIARLLVKSTIMRDALEDIVGLSEEIPFREIMVHSHTLQISSIAKQLDIRVRICPFAKRNPNEMNMIGWHQFPTSMPRGFHEGSDEVMLTLYKIKELVFDAIVLYPLKVYNFESREFEYKKNSFMRLIPHEKNKNYKIYDESGFYRSIVDSILRYFKEFERIQLDPSADVGDKDLLVFAMYFDFMSYVAQQLGFYHDEETSLDKCTKNLIEVIIKCSEKFDASHWVVNSGMCAIVTESYPEPRYIKDKDSDCQSQKSVRWSEYINKDLNAVLVKELLVDNMGTNDTNPHASHLRRGANAIQGLKSNFKRKRKWIPRTPLGLQKLNEVDSPSGEDTWGSESASPAYNPTSPPNSVETTESSGKSQSQGQGTTLEFKPVREPEPAVDFYSDERTDMSMFAMDSVQIAQSNWIVDSRAGKSGTSSTINLKDTMRCKIPITPAFGAVMNATSESLINDPTFKELDINAIHIEGMHHNLMSVHQVCTGGNTGEEHVGIFTSEGGQFFPLSKCREALKIMSKCNNTFYGLVVYVYAPAGSKK